MELGADSFFSKGNFEFHFYSLVLGEISLFSDLSMDFIAGTATILVFLVWGGFIFWRMDKCYRGIDDKG